MVAIQDKISVANLVDVNGRQIGNVGNGRFHPHPTVLIRTQPGQEGARKIMVTPHAAHNRRYRNLAQTLSSLANDVQLFSHLVVRQQIG
jgi:hypothetical protein